MKLDLLLLGLLIFAMARGARRGAARQLGELGAAGASFFFARPLANELEPRLAELLTLPSDWSRSGVIIMAAIVIFVSVRAFLTGVFRHLFTDARDPEGPGRDRFLGGILGGLKLAALTWILLSAATQLEGGSTRVGRSIGVLPQDSRVVELTRRHNLFDGRTGRRFVRELEHPTLGTVLRSPFQFLPRSL